MWDGRAREHRGRSPAAFQGTELLPLPEMQQLSDINRVKKKIKENTPLWPKLGIFLQQNDNTVLVKIAFPCSREGKGR